MDSSADEKKAADDGVIGMLERGRRQFLALVEPVRPDLHRYCARMTGSMVDGEDVVQETLARANYELSQWTELPPLRPWLFRIAHNRAIDHWRHESYRRVEPLDAALDVAHEPAHEPDNALARDQTVRAALGCFLQLAPAQRGCVILKDVLDHSTYAIADELNLSVPAVKAALHRGRCATSATCPTTREKATSSSPGSEARRSNHYASPRIHAFNPPAFEIRGVARDNAQSVRKLRRSDQAVDDGQRLPAALGRAHDCTPSPNDRQVDGQDAAFESTRQIIAHALAQPRLSARRGQLSDAPFELADGQHAQEQRVFVMLGKPAQQTGVRRGFDQFENDAGVEQVDHSATGRPTSALRVISSSMPTSADQRKKATKLPSRGASLRY